MNQERLREEIKTRLMYAVPFKINEFDLDVAVNSMVDLLTQELQALGREMFNSIPLQVQHPNPDKVEGWKTGIRASLGSLRDVLSHRGIKLE